MARKTPNIELPPEKERIVDQKNKRPDFAARTQDELMKQLFAEQNNQEAEEATEEFLTAKTSVHKARPGEEWDVPIDEEIQYFDSELSYELTGYRPITMQKGLDFDPAPFREAAAIYDRDGAFTEFPEGSKKWREFWMEQVDRCKNGYTVGRYRVTGDHYFFLNFYRMETVVENAISGAGRKEAFPSFLAKQYEFFHYIEMCEKLHKDVCILKARGLGASEMLATLAVRPYTVLPNYNVIITCAAEAKLQPLREKC